MKITIEILNEKFETVETMWPLYTGARVVTDHTGKHTETESLKEFIYSCGGIASEELLERPGHCSILYQDGTPTEIYQYEDDES